MLADLAGISRAGLHYIVSGKKAATIDTLAIDTLAEIAEALAEHPSVLPAPRSEGEVAV